MNFTKTTAAILFLTNALLLSSCSEKQPKEVVVNLTHAKQSTLVVLGTTQDAGSPQITCKKACCEGLFESPNPKRKVVSLGLIDISTNKTYLFEATPDIGSQIKKLTKLEQNSGNEMVDGIFLTHAHIGHYTGLMYLGKEAMDAKSTPVYAMPRMRTFLENNGPWSQLLLQENISIHPLQAEATVRLSDKLNVTPFAVPHRDEFSETVGYKIQGPNKIALFIPDIDKWEKWEKDIVAEIEKVDYAFLDATFFDGEELNNRDISQIPHPFIMESFRHFKSMSAANKRKVIFIHFNHTNPVLDSTSEAYKMVLQKGFRIARMNEQFEL